MTEGPLAGIGDAVGSQNVQGEAQKKLDVIANEVLVEANEWGGHLAAMVSAEMEQPYLIPNRYPRGGFLLLMDPIDGSSNLDVNLSVGTIFSVLRCPSPAPLNSAITGGHLRVPPPICPIPASAVPRGRSLSCRTCT